jgi:hypothetical protein
MKSKETKSKPKKKSIVKSNSKAKEIQPKKKKQNVIKVAELED